MATTDLVTGNTSLVTDMMHMMSGGSHGGQHPMGSHGDHHHPMGMTTNGHNQHMMNTHSGHGDDDHTDHSSMGGHGMYFTIGEKVILLIRDFSVIEDDIGNFIAACVVIFIIAALYEGLKVAREMLIRRCSTNQGYEATDLEKRGSMAPLSGLDDIPTSTWCNGWHVLQSFLHIIQVTISYILMLLVMSLNVWIGLSVVLGAGFGYFLFAWKRTTTTDSNEHCH